MVLYLYKLNESPHGIPWRSQRLLHVAVSDFVVRHRLALTALVAAVEAPAHLALLLDVPGWAAGPNDEREL